MSTIEPTEQQLKIINETRNTVVIAKPGSGKTFVLSRKIKNILPKLYEYQGVAAISYTNKASDELKHRCLSGGVDTKSSFFGTIDKFYISEIVMPFGKHIWGMPTTQLTVISLSELQDPVKKALSWIDMSFEYSNLTDAHLSQLESLFLGGQIVLETVGLLALFIFDNSLACRKYLKSRYTHIIIDEYQDSGKEQHEIFIRLHSIDLCAIAVGDADQSIYGFSGKDARHLLSLAKQPGFAIYPLTINHRSHPSIINYSTALLTTIFEPLETNEIRVFEKFINGNEAAIANWIDIAIPYFQRIFGITDLKDIGILVRPNRTGKLISENLRHKHKLFVSTSLDEDTNLWSSVFSRLLRHLFNTADTKIEFIEEFINVEVHPIKARNIMRLIDKIKPLFENTTKNIDQILDGFIQIALLIFPTGNSDKSIKLLKAILAQPNELISYMPAQSDEVQIMTIHKSKGLEFTLVFHLDLHEWILPAKQYHRETRSTSFPSYEQDINLHYVGVTRAKECCVLCCSSIRHNWEMAPKSGSYSEFFFIEGTHELRLPSPI